MKKFSKILLVVLLFMICPVVNAETIEHFYAKAGDDVVLKDDANASVALAGTNVEINSNISGISAGIGDQVKFSGTADYAALVGNNVEVDGTINNDALIIGSIVNSSTSTEFNRDIIIVGSEVNLSGTFARNVSVYATSVTVKDANIAGNLKVQASNITVESGKVEGTLSYPEDSRVNISDSAAINKVVKTDALNSEEENSYFTLVSSKLWSFACYALIFAFMCLLLPKVITKISDKYQKLDVSTGIEVFTKGLVFIILVPIICMLLFVAAIGIPLAIIGLLLYGIAIYLSTMFTAYLLGYKIWQKVFNKDMNMLLIGLMGLFILFILNIIPGINYLVAIITVLFGLGLIFDSIKGSR